MKTNRIKSFGKRYGYVNVRYKLNRKKLLFTFAVILITLEILAGILCLIKF